MLIRIGKRGARKVEHKPKRTQAGLDIPDAFLICNLGEAHREELISAGEMPHPMLALVAFENLAEHEPRCEVNQLRKNISAKMHAIASGEVTVMEEKVTAEIQWS